MTIILISADQLSAFEVVVSQLLEDVQERLVYKAQVTRPTNSICLAFFVLFCFKVKQYSISSKEQRTPLQSPDLSCTYNFSICYFTQTYFNNLKHRGKGHFEIKLAVRVLHSILTTL